MDLLLILIGNTVLCVLALMPAFGLQLATVMGGAAPGAGPLGVWIVGLGILLPALPILSVVGSWIAYLLGWGVVAIGFVALPWAYLLVLLLIIGVFFIRAR